MCLKPRQQVRGVGTGARAARGDGAMGRRGVADAVNSEETACVSFGFIVLDLGRLPCRLDLCPVQVKMRSLSEASLTKVL